MIDRHAEVQVHRFSGISLRHGNRRPENFDNYFSANIWLTRLQDAGIHCFLLDENTVTIDPILTNAIGGIKLAVSEEDEAAARDMLLAFEQEYRRSARCPRCGSDQFLQVPRRNAGNMLTAVLTWLFLVLPYPPNRFTNASNVAMKVIHCQIRARRN